MSFRNNELIYFPSYFVLLLLIVFPVNCFLEMEYSGVILHFSCK
jgi:hypothetical protein